MRIVEVKKGQADIKHGMVMMAIEGSLSAIESASLSLKGMGWNDTSCTDEIEDDVYALYFVMERNEVKPFRAAFKEVKKSAR